MQAVVRPCANNSSAAPNASAKPACPAGMACRAWGATRTPEYSTIRSRSRSFGGTRSAGRPPPRFEVGQADTKRHLGAGVETRRGDELTQRRNREREQACLSLKTGDRRHRMADHRHRSLLGIKRYPRKLAGASEARSDSSAGAHSSAERSVGADSRNGYALAGHGFRSVNSPAPCRRESCGPGQPGSRG